MNNKIDNNLKTVSKIITIHGYRNSPIEKIHAGIHPRSKKGDYSDVKVVTPYGEIAWNNVSKISDKEMKELNKTIHNQIYTLLTMLQEGTLSSFLANWGADWDEPELLEELYKFRLK